MQRDIILASNNIHKIQEISQILGSNWNVISAQAIDPFISWNETGTTFLENARLKVKAIQDNPATPKGVCILADDSGLCVDALKGGPGVYSSSYCGVEGDHQGNVAKLLDAMQSIPEAARTGYFYCLLLFVDQDGREIPFEGKCFGFIAQVQKGGHGFGYDPIFVVPSFQRSMAELSDSEKNSVSHRGQAMNSFIDYIRSRSIF